MVFYKIFFKFFSKFTEKHLCKGSRFNKINKQRLSDRCFPKNFTKFLRIQNLHGTYLQLLLVSVYSLEIFWPVKTLCPNYLNSQLIIIWINVIISCMTGKIIESSFQCVISGIQLDYKENNQKRNHCWN